MPGERAVSWRNRPERLRVHHRAFRHGEALHLMALLRSLDLSIGPESINRPRVTALQTAMLPELFNKARKSLGTPAC